MNTPEVIGEIIGQLIIIGALYGVTKLLYNYAQGIKGKAHLKSKFNIPLLVGCVVLYLLVGIPLGLIRFS